MPKVAAGERCGDGSRWFAGLSAIASLEAPGAEPATDHELHSMSRRDKPNIEGNSPMVRTTLDDFGGLATRSAGGRERR